MNAEHKAATFTPKELEENSILLDSEESFDKASGWLRDGRKAYCIGRNSTGVIMTFHKPDEEKADPDPAVVAARDIHKSLQQAIVEHPIDGFESDAIPRIRTAYAQRDKAWAELAELAEKYLPMLRTRKHRYEGDDDRCGHYRYEKCDCGLDELIAALTTLMGGE